MLVYEERRHDESIPQVCALERAFKQSSEGQRNNKLIREKNIEGFLPKSVDAYMNAAEGFASEAEAALRKARKYADAAGGRFTAAVAAGTIPDAEVLIKPMRSMYNGSTLISIRFLRWSLLNPRRNPVL